MNLERGYIFTNNPIWYLILSALMVGGGCYVYFVAAQPAGVILILLGLGWFVGYTLLATFSITVSPTGISKSSVLKGWNVKWQRITGWNIVRISSQETWKSTIWFRTGANIYKIDPDVLRKNGDLEKLTAYFEKHCGKQTEGENRLRLKIF